MKGFIETHTIGWLNQVQVEDVENLSIEKKSQIVCEVLAGLPLPLIVVEERKSHFLVAVTQMPCVKALKEFMKGVFKIASNPAEKFVSPDVLGKSFEELPNEALFDERQIAVCVVDQFTPEERDFIQSASFYASVSQKAGSIMQELTEKELKSVAVVNPRLTASVYFNPIDASLERQLQHPFFEKVNIPNLNTEIVVQLLMVSPEGTTQDLSSRNVMEFKTQPIDSEKLTEMTKVLDYLNQVFLNKYPNLKKAHLPMVYICAEEALGKKVSPNDFYGIINDFFDANIPAYKEAGQSGTASKSNVNKRIRIMFDYFKKHI